MISVRVCVILQLCMAFCVLSLHFVRPFMGEHFKIRSRMLLYEFVMGSSDKMQEDENKGLRQQERFSNLAQDTKESLTHDYLLLKNYIQRPLHQKLHDGGKHLVNDIPLFELSWIFFSVVIGILILLKVEGALFSSWLLFIIAFCYCFDNQLNGRLQPTPPDTILFPAEESIMEKNQLQGSLLSIREQKMALENGWKEYLLEHWASAKESNLEAAEFNFFLERLKLLRNQPLSDWLFFSDAKLSPLWVFLYLFWNAFFAWTSYPLNFKKLKNPDSYKISNDCG